jgi:hypothetical protein
MYSLAEKGAAIGSSTVGNRFCCWVVSAVTSRCQGVVDECVRFGARLDRLLRLKTRACRSVLPIDDCAGGCKLDGGMRRRLFWDGRPDTFSLVLLPVPPFPPRGRVLSWDSFLHVECAGTKIRMRSDLVLCSDDILVSTSGTVSISIIYHE